MSIRVFISVSVGGAISIVHVGTVVSRYRISFNVMIGGGAMFSEISSGI
jgi:hypothetical protein